MANSFAVFACSAGAFVGVSTNGLGKVGCFFACTTVRSRVATLQLARSEKLGELGLSNKVMPNLRCLDNLTLDTSSSPFSSPLFADFRHTLSTPVCSLLIQTNSLVYCCSLSHSQHRSSYLFVVSHNFSTHQFSNRHCP